MDRYVQGERVSIEQVLLGDPPIDWDLVRTREDHFRWLAMRDSYPASLIQLEVLAKRRKALVVYGHLHFQRYQILSNLDMSDWRMQTIVSLIERSSPTRVFTIWRLDDELSEAAPDLATWPVPAFVATAGTALGASDITRIHPTSERFTFRGDERVAVPREQWASLPIEKQFDAVLLSWPACTHDARRPSRRALDRASSRNGSDGSASLEYLPSRPTTSGSSAPPARARRAPSLP